MFEFFRHVYSYDYQCDTHTCTLSRSVSVSVSLYISLSIYIYIYIYCTLIYRLSLFFDPLNFHTYTRVLSLLIQFLILFFFSLPFLLFSFSHVFRSFLLFGLSFSYFLFFFYRIITPSIYQSISLYIYKYISSHSFFFLFSCPTSSLICFFLYDLTQLSLLTPFNFEFYFHVLPLN